MKKFLHNTLPPLLAIPFFVMSAHAAEVGTTPIRGGICEDEVEICQAMAERAMDLIEECRNTGRGCEEAMDAALDAIGVCLYAAELCARS